MSIGKQKGTNSIKSLWTFRLCSSWCFSRSWCEKCTQNSCNGLRLIIKFRGYPRFIRFIDV